MGRRKKKPKVSNRLQSIINNVLLAVVFFLYAFFYSMGNPDIDMSLAKQSVPESIEEEQPRKGSVVPYNEMSLYDTDFSDVSFLLRPLSLNELDKETEFKKDNKKFNYYAPGTDKDEHPSNAFLIHFKPFDTDQVWQPMAYIAARLRYAHDEVTFGPREVWQTSRQAYRRMRGDCEDHAILLVDWLVEMGYDARVVVGKMDDEGHAWAVLLHEGKEYLIEATSKVSRRRFPYAISHSNYSADYMFNQDVFWKNTGKKSLNIYNSDKWIKLSKFEELKI